ncbi:MAG: ATP-binding protein, partial [Prevotella sp.]|nr:ATP-binding protein [Prevotella sp.]
FSFLDETEFNMLPAKSLKRHTDHLHKINTIVSVLKGSVIYGANGAGKSNLIKAAELMKRIVVSGKVPDDIHYIRNKFSDDNTPISQSIEYSIGNKIYNYGFSYTSGLCLEEWLYETGIERAEMIFERTYNEEKRKSVIKMGKRFLAKDEKNVMLIKVLEENILKPDELLVAHDNIIKDMKISTVRPWFANNLLIFFPTTKSQSIFNSQYSDTAFKQYSEKLMRGFDVGVNGIELHEDDLDTFVSQTGMPLNEMFEDIKANLKKVSADVIETQYFTIGVTREANDKYVIRRITTKHEVGDKEVEFELKEESDGTRRLFDFAPILYELRDSDKTFIVDEIDRSIHANLLKCFVGKVMSLPIKGQVIFSSHESCLLDCDIFRNDEIWFAEKDRETQSTHFYTLNDFKPRNDLDIEKGYLKGRFGAIPFLSHLEDLNWE